MAACHPPLQPQQSTFGKGASSGSGLYKAESLSLEAVRGDRGNHSSFFPEQQQQGKYCEPNTATATLSCLLASSDHDSVSARATARLPGGDPAKVSLSGCYEEMRYRQARGSPPEPAPPDPPHHHQQRPGLSKASTMPGPGSHTSLEELTCRNSDQLYVFSQNPPVLKHSKQFYILEIFDC